MSDNLQYIASDLTGRVVNSTGEGIEGVEVLIFNTKLNVQRGKAVTNTNGEFELRGINANLNIRTIINGVLVFDHLIRQRSLINVVISGA